MEEFESLLILMVVVWVAGKFFRSLSLPVVFGELLGGIIVGPLVLNLINPESAGLNILAELGVFFLMLHAGLETDPNELFKGSKKSFLIAIGGVLVPFIGGYFVSQYFGLTTYQALFVATSISATAIAMSVRILKEYNLKDTVFGHTILSAAIISDIIILVIFSLLIKFVETGSIDAALALTMLTKIGLFFGITIFAGFKMQRIFSPFFRNKGFTLTLVIALFMGLLAESIGLHIIIGAFLAGLFIREELLEGKTFKKIEDRVYGLSYSFLGPIFFATLAFSLQFDVLSTKPIFLISLLAVAFFGKMIGAGGGAFIQGVPKLRSLLIGLTMNSRGALDLIIISLGLKKGIIDNEIFSLLVVIAFTTTLITIFTVKPFKKYLLKHCS